MPKGTRPGCTAASYNLEVAMDQSDLSDMVALRYCGFYSCCSIIVMGNVNKDIVAARFYLLYWKSGTAQGSDKINWLLLNPWPGHSLVGKMLRANNVDLEGVERFLVENDVPLFERELLPLHNNTPAPQVEFEMRHTREHLEKLKFNWLELHTKRAFLLHLSDGDEWRACQTSRWTPGELKQLERELEPAKAALKTEKERTAQLQRTLSEDCETLLTLQEAVRAKHSHATSLTSQYRKEFASLQELRSMLPNQMARSVEELQAQLDEQSISLEKKVTSLDRQRAAVADLERLLTVHEVDNAKLQSNRSELDAKRISLSQRGAGEAALSSLCQWYTNLTESLSNLTGCKVEMVQPSYLLATVISASSIVPVHIYVDAVSGKLQSVKVGSTSATPKRQWKELVEAAIEYNDIPFLLRSIHSAISSK